MHAPRAHSPNQPHQSAGRESNPTHNPEIWRTASIFPDTVCVDFVNNTGRVQSIKVRGRLETRLDVPPGHVYICLCNPKVNRLRGATNLFLTCISTDVRINMMRALRPRSQKFEISLTHDSGLRKGLYCALYSPPWDRGRLRLVSCACNEAYEAGMSVPVRLLERSSCANVHPAQPAVQLREISPGPRGTSPRRRRTSPGSDGSRDQQPLDPGRRQRSTRPDRSGSRSPLQGYSRHTHHYGR